MTKQNFTYVSVPEGKSFWRIGEIRFRSRTHEKDQPGKIGQNPYVAVHNETPLGMRESYYWAFPGTKELIIMDDPHYIPEEGWPVYTGGRSYTPEECRTGIMSANGIIPGTEQPKEPEDTAPSEFWDDVYKKAFESQQKFEDTKPVVDTKIKADTPEEQNRIMDLLREAARG